MEQTTRHKNKALNRLKIDNQRRSPQNKAIIDKAGKVIILFLSVKVLYYT